MCEPPANDDSRVIFNGRSISASPQRIFAAFEREGEFAQWWGPDGFTNSFSQFEFRPGARWIFVMHGPDGRDYPNECMVREIEPYTRIVIEHVVAPLFVLTVTLTVRGEQTHIAWHQAFESKEVAAAVRPVCDISNEQVLDRLQSLVEADSAETDGLTDGWQRLV